MIGFMGHEVPKCPYCSEGCIEEFDEMFEELAQEMRVEMGEVESKKRLISCPECGTKFKARVCLSAIWEIEEESK